MGFVSSAAAADPHPEKPVSFAAEIAPILASKCVACHGPNKSKGSFRLDTFEHLNQAGDSEANAVVPGSPDKSLLFTLITTENPEDRMPQDDDPLTEELADRIRRWISEGAHVPEQERSLAVSILAASGRHPAPPTRYPRPNPVHALTFSPGASLLAVGGFHEITLWELPSGTLRSRWNNMAERIHKLAFSSDGTRLLVVGGNPGRLGEALLLDASDGRLLRVLALAPDSLLAGAFSPDGSRVAVAGCDRLIHIVRTGDGSLEQTLPQHSDWVMDLAFSPSGQRLCSASRDGSARAFLVGTGEMISAYRGHDQAVMAAAFGLDDSLVFTASGNQVHAWNPGNGKKEKSGQPVRTDILAMGRAGDQLWLASSDGSVTSLSVETPGKATRSLPGPSDAAYSLAIDAKSHRLAVGGADGSVHVWNLESPEETTRFMASPGWETP